MWKKIASVFFIVSGMAALCVSSSPDAMRYLKGKRRIDRWWGDGYDLYGDLVRRANLGFVKKFSPPQPGFVFKKPVHAGTKNTVLYLCGDSYTQETGDSVFSGLCGFHFIDRYDGGYYHLDTTKRNILLFEITERDVHHFFENLQMLYDIKDISALNGRPSLLPGVRSASFSCYASVFPGIDLHVIFNRYINQNLQYNLFTYQFLCAIFESKAAINYYIFKRASGDVTISDDDNFLFFAETVSADDIHSSCSPVPAAEFTLLAGHINMYYDRFKAKGFSEVYLSIIPNPATIMQPAGYNNLIPRIENDSRIRMKMIDVYNTFKDSKELLYLPGDTHWNKQGKQMWIDAVNKALESGN